MPSTSWGGDAYATMDMVNQLSAWITGSPSQKKAADEFSQWRADQYKPYASPEQMMRRYYFSGYNSMSDDDKKSFDTRYPEIGKLSPEKKDNFFRNKMFSEVFKNSENPEDQEIWANRHSLTKRERDDLFAKKAISEDVDGVSDL